MALVEDVCQFSLQIVIYSEVSAERFRDQSVHVVISSFGHYTMQSVSQSVGLCFYYADKTFIEDCDIKPD